jgi:hypothetical protein
VPVAECGCSRDSGRLYETVVSIHSRSKRSAPDSTTRCQSAHGLLTEVKRLCIGHRFALADGSFRCGCTSCIGHRSWVGNSHMSLRALHSENTRSYSEKSASQTIKHATHNNTTRWVLDGVERACVCVCVCVCVCDTRRVDSE